MVADAAELCVREVAIAGPDETAAAAAVRMRERHVGDLVVVTAHDGLHVPVGIVTDRDLVLSVMAEQRDPDEVTLAEIMGRVLVTVSAHTEIPAVLDAMKANGVRRMPVVDDDGGLVGILSYDDLVEWMAEELGSLVTIVRKEQRVEHARRP